MILVFLLEQSTNGARALGITTILVQNEPIVILSSPGEHGIDVAATLSAEPPGNVFENTTSQPSKTGKSNVR